MVQQQHQIPLDKALTTLDELAALDEMFKPKESASMVSTQSKRHKAAITVLGQGKNPGGSMAVVLGYADLFNQAAYENSAEVNGFVRFLHAFSGV